METKICKDCNKEKDISEFYTNGFTPRGTRKYKPTCKPCEMVRNKNRFLEKVKSILEGLDRSFQCERCGYDKHPAALHFHHNQGIKNFAISNNKNAHVDKLKAEIQLCEVLCANCHAIEHYFDI